MTTPIKPEDIPDEMDEICEGMLYKRDIADILNTAIELGVVSPAVVARIEPDPVEVRDVWHVYAYKYKDRTCRMTYRRETREEAEWDLFGRMSRGFEIADLEHVREIVLSREEVKGEGK